MYVNVSACLPVKKKKKQRNLISKLLIEFARVLHVQIDTHM